jgi:hypothetical protein
VEGKGPFSSSVSLIRHEAGGKLVFIQCQHLLLIFLNYPPQGRSLRED